MSSSPAASSSPVAADVPPPRILLVAAFAALYVIWGSTYFGIAVAIETIPPFPMVGIRQLVAGVVLVAILRARGVAWPDRAHWTGAIVGGVLLLVLGNGLVAWAEQHIASGVASLVIATTPLSIMTIAALVPGGERPTARAVAGLLLGCAGLVVLAWPGAMAALRGEAAHGGIDAFGLVVLVFATICWATGTVLGRFLPRHANAFMASAQQMLVAGVVLLVTTMITGDLGRLDLGAISARSWLALGYLIAIGSLLGFTAFVWLLRVQPPSRVATYAYVNPVVALVIGSWLGHERIDARTLAAAAVVLAGVVLVVMPPRRARAAAPATPSPVPSTADT